MFTVGIDIEDIGRFQDKTLMSDAKFLYRIFTQNELEYCFKNSNPAPHLAARYCAKEAFVKAISNIYQYNVPYSKIEILKNDNGSVFLNPLLDSLKKYSYSLSISHEKDKAIAIVIVEYNN